MERDYPGIRPVVTELSEKELDHAWEAVEHLDMVLASDDQPLMAWAVTSPGDGLLVLCTSGLMFCPNHGIQGFALWSRRTILSHDGEDDVLTLHLRGDEAVAIRLVEDQGEILGDAVESLCTIHSTRQLVRLFGEWRAEREPE